MRTTLTLNDDLIKKAQTLTGLQEKSALIHEALKALIARETSRRFSRLGRREPEWTLAPQPWTKS